MEKEEMAYYKNEIARLNKIIEVIIRYNDLLNEEIALLKTGKRFRNAEMAQVETGGPLGKTEMAHVESDMGYSNVRMVHPETGMPLGKAEMVHVKTDIGHSDVTKGLPETDMGHPNAAKPLPGFIEPSAKMLTALRGIMRRDGFIRVRYEAIRNASLLLIHFHNKKGGGHDELGRLTGLSRYGISKFVASLKKRGLIHRTGWQQFAVSSKAEAMIREAWEKTDGGEKSEMQ